LILRGSYAESSVDYQETRRITLKLIHDNDFTYKLENNKLTKEKFGKKKSHITEGRKIVDK